MLCHYCWDSASSPVERGGPRETPTLRASRLVRVQRLVRSPRPQPPATRLQRGVPELPCATEQGQATSWGQHADPGFREGKTGQLRGHWLFYGRTISWGPGSGPAGGVCAQSGPLTSLWVSPA